MIRQYRLEVANKRTHWAYELYSKSLEDIRGRAKNFDRRSYDVRLCRESFNRPGGKIVREPVSLEVL